MSASIDWLDTAISKYLTGRLAQFRVDLEKGTGQPIGVLQVNAALLLSDLCRFMGLDEEQHNHVLGKSGVQHVMRVLETRISVRMTTSPVPHGSAPEAGRVVAVPLSGVGS